MSLRFLGLIAFFVVVAGGWFATRTPVDQEGVRSRQDLHEGGAAKVAAPPPPPVEPSRDLPTFAPAPDEDALRPPPLALSRTPPVWERQIADAASGGRDATATARAILGLLPTLPEEALATATEQAIEGLPDRDYPAAAHPILLDPKTHGQVLSVLFADLMERPDAITLPALLIIASNRSHPFSEPALDNLRLLLRVDFGSNWPQWKTAIDRKLSQ